MSVAQSWLLVSRSAVLTFAASCGAASPGRLNQDDAQALIDRAGQLEASGNLSGAEKAYLECLEWCPVTLRAFAGSRLHDIVENREQVDRFTEDVVSRIEARVVSGDPSSDEFLADVVALAAVYEQWSRPERVEKLLAAIEVQSSPDAHAAALELFATFFPRAFRRMTAEQVQILLAATERAPREDRRAIGGVEPTAEEGAVLEQLRVSTAAAHAAALLSAQRAEAARSVVRMAVAGVREDGCEKLVGEIETTEWSELLEVVCEECNAVDRCAESAR